MHEFVKAMNHAFDGAILLGGMREGEPDMKTSEGCKVLKVGVVEFTSFITLKGFDGGIKLSLDIFVKLVDFVKSVGFVFERKDPCVVRIIIDYNKIVFETHITWDG